MNKHTMSARNTAENKNTATLHTTVCKDLYLECYCPYTLADYFEEPIEQPPCHRQNRNGTQNAHAPAKSAVALEYDNHVGEPPSWSMFTICCAAATSGISVASTLVPFSSVVILLKGKAWFDKIPLVVSKRSFFAHTSTNTRHTSTNTITRRRHET